MRARDTTTRECILLAATRLLANGRTRREMTVRRICAEAGVGIGLINYHFGSKEALLGEAREAVVLALVTNLFPGRRESARS